MHLTQYVLLLTNPSYYPIIHIHFYINDQGANKDLLTVYILGYPVPEMAHLYNLRHIVINQVIWIKLYSVYCLQLKL